MFDLNTLIYVAPAIIITVTLHELAHGWVSYKFGDPTPKEDGRLSLNPLRHLDPIGTIALLVAGFGWAKPVHIDPRYYKDAKTGVVWTAFAGPMMNFIIAFIAVFLYNLLRNGLYGMVSTPLAGHTEVAFQIMIYLMNLMLYTALISLGQAIFNLIPLPPLDGSKILYGLLPDSVYFGIMRYENWLSLILFVVLFSGVLDGPLISIRTVIFDGMNNLCALIL